jgi:DNA-binding transcriptional LysR family regulator
VSQQLAVLEREAGVALIDRSGRGVRLTDAGHVLVRHARVLLDRAERAEAELAAAHGAPVGRARIAAFQSVSLGLAPTALAMLADSAPLLRAELIEAEPEVALPALALGDFDVVLADEWPAHPRPRVQGVDEHDLLADPIRVALPVDHPVACEHSEVVDLRELAGESWVSSDPGVGYSAVTIRMCRDHGGFEPDIRHRTNDGVVALRLVSRGLAAMIVPELVAAGQTGVALRRIEGAPVTRRIFAATRSADAERPSVKVVLDALRTAVTTRPPT